MSESAITIEDLSKRYLIGRRTSDQGRSRYVALRDVIGPAAKTLTRKAIDLVRGRQVLYGNYVEEFWALKNVSFDVRRGEIVGIIGRNGAGKSTLLKILSRITEPTKGRVSLRGRVASLLEVGTGFHPELTGRENVFLNGAILGMTRREITRKFDEIVAFAEVERFLDTPVKRYSSGMYVRLAFAVAAHLEPEILIVDEVLAVGDTEFQRKCLGKMDEVSRQKGRTVLFVSHNLAAVSEMADRAILLDEGSVVVDGSVATAISSYLSRTTRKAAETTYLRQADIQTDHPHMVKAQVLTSDPNGVHRFGEPLVIKFWIQCPVPKKNVSFAFQIYNQFQTAVIHSSYYQSKMFGSRLGCSILVCRFSRLSLNVGQFYLRTWLQEKDDIYETLDGICPFEVMRIDRSQFLGWRPDVCTYHEEHDWSETEGECLPRATE
jgi:lipopolysaccharide transport system ATP-binding protein